MYGPGCNTLSKLNGRRGRTLGTNTSALEHDMKGRAHTWERREPWCKFRSAMYAIRSIAHTTIRHDAPLRPKVLALLRTVTFGCAHWSSLRLNLRHALPTMRGRPQGAVTAVGQVSLPAKPAGGDITRTPGDSETGRATSNEKGERADTEAEKLSTASDYRVVGARGPERERKGIRA